MILGEQEIQQFQYKIYNFYAKNRRDFIWRNEITPYKIVVSEIMLQQTQTSRVLLKFVQWMEKFPGLLELSRASLGEVLFYWQGLGYNRRGLALHNFAKKIMQDFSGIIPEDPETLKTFKGIGINTAGSICAFAFNKPVVFIETNIRTVFIHEFFAHEKNIDDKELLVLIKDSLDMQNPRDWYYALMDYGAYLKKELKLNNKKSKHYVRQSSFSGSKRQIRGAIIRIMSRMHKLSYDQLSELVLLDYPYTIYNIQDIAQDLKKEGLLKEKNGDIICI